MDRHQLVRAESGSKETLGKGVALCFLDPGRHRS
jgi:hypothetical protein